MTLPSGGGGDFNTGRKLVPNGAEINILSVGSLHYSRCTGYAKVVDDHIEIRLVVHHPTYAFDSGWQDEYSYTKSEGGYEYHDWKWVVSWIPGGVHVASYRINQEYGPWEVMGSSSVYW